MLADMEFNTTSGEVDVMPDQHRVCFNVTPILDNVVEDNETFSIALNTSDSAIILPNATAVITVLNADRKFLLVMQASNNSLLFLPRSHSVSEPVPVCVE